MQDKKEGKAYFVDPETNEHFYMGAGPIEVKQEGDKWSAKVELNTTKTQAVLNLLHFAANAGGEEKSKEAKDAARVLEVFYKNLERLQIIETEDAAGVKFHWKTKEGVREAAADAAVKEVLGLPIVQAAVKHIFQIARDTGGAVEVKKDGGPLKMSPYMAQTRIPEKEKGAHGPTKTTYKKPKIELTPAQTKFERAILRLLRDNSILDREHPEYFLGNGGEGRQKVEVWSEVQPDKWVQEFEQIPYARLLISWPDLYKAYADKPAAKISGKERQTIRELLEGIKRELGETVWQREIKRNGQKIVQRFRLESPLIIQGSAAELTPEEADAVEAGGEVPEDKERLLLLLHPAYTHDIAKKTHAWPDDYDRRLSKVLGKGGKIKTAHERLFTYLNQIRCGGKPGTPANLETLVTMMGLERIKAKQGLPKVRAEIKEGLEIMKGVKLVLSYTTTPGARGQEQYQIIFNPDFAK